MYAFSPSWSESPGHWHHILGAISLTDFMKEFLHSVAGVALCRGDNKGIPRMPCVICTARLRKSLPAPGSPPHCWFSGTHPHPGAINAGSLLCRGGGVEQIYCGWSPHKGPRHCHNRARISCRRFRTVWFQVPTSHDRRCRRELCPECSDAVTKCVSSLRPTPVAHKDTRCTHCALRRWHETQSVWSQVRGRKRRSHWWKLILSQRWIPFLHSTFSWNEFLHAGIWDVR